MSYQPTPAPSDTQRVSLAERPRCVNCDIAILWQPIVVQGRAYCCTGCAAGGPCNCDYSQYSMVSVGETRRHHSVTGTTETHVPMPGDEPAQ
jgi:hypothetical protein